MAQEECYSYQRIASVVALGIDHTAVTFAANHSAYAFHFGHHIHLAYGTGAIFASMSTCYIAQRPRTRHIAYRVTGRVRQHIVGYAHQRIFFAEHLTVLADDSQAVYVRIHYKSYIRFAALEQLADLSQVLR